MADRCYALPPSCSAERLQNTRPISKATNILLPQSRSGRVIYSKLVELAVLQPCSLAVDEYFSLISATRSPSALQSRSRRLMASVANEVHYVCRALVPKLHVVQLAQSRLEDWMNRILSGQGNLQTSLQSFQPARSLRDSQA